MKDDSMLRIRKVMVHVEDTHREGMRELRRVVRKVGVAAVIQNPYAGRDVEDLSPLYELGRQLGELLSARAVAQLEGRPVEVYGKAALVGLDGELEHGAAVIHPRMGRPLREAVGGGKAVIPSSAKCAVAGTSIDVPLHNKDDEWRFDCFDAMELRVPDAPKADEIVVFIVLSDAGRPCERIGRTRS